MKMILAAMMMAVLMFSGLAIAGDKVNVNTASVQQLQEVKGIGVKTAGAIVAYRESHGTFKSLDELTRVKGIGHKKLAKIEDHVEVIDSNDD